MAQAHLTLLLCLLVVGVSLAPAQPPPPPEPKVTLEATDQPTAEVVAEIGKQIGAQVGLIGPAPQQVTVSLKEAKPDEAVATLADALGASWVRSYVLESAPPPTPFTPDQLLAGLMNQRDGWFESLTEQQRETIMALAMLSLREGAQRPKIAGAGMAKPPEQPGGAAGPGPGGMFQGRYDAVRQLIIPLRSETVTLKLADKPLPQALLELMTASKFIIAAGADLAGNVTLEANQQPLEKVVAEIAAAVNAQWRPIYLLSVPRALSESEMDKQVDNALQSRMGQFWSLPRERRAEEVQKWSGRLDQWGNMARTPNADGTPSMMNRALTAVGPKVLTWLTEYTATLPQDQRNEIKPLLQALGKAIPH